MPRTPGHRDAFYGADYVALVQRLSELATLELGLTIPAGHRFLDGMAVDGERRARRLAGAPRWTLGSRIDAGPPAEFGQVSPIAEVLTHAALTIVGGNELAPQVADMLDDVAVAIDIRDDGQLVE